MDELIPRAATEQLRESVRDFRVVIVNGPRQAGKTTLLEMFRDDHGGTIGRWMKQSSWERPAGIR